MAKMKSQKKTKQYYIVIGSMMNKLWILNIVLIRVTEGGIRDEYSSQENGYEF